MADEQAVVADSASEAQAAPSVAAEPTDVTHGEPTEQASTVEAEGSSTPDDTGELDDKTFEEQIKDLSEEEKKTKSQERRERRIAREQERIDREVAARLEAKEREQQAEADRQKREADAQKAREERAKQFAQYIGEDGEADRLAAEIADLNRQIRAEVSDPKGVDLDEIEAGISKKEARLADIQKAQGFESSIRNDIWNGIEAAMYTPFQWPEFANSPEARQAYAGAEGGIAGLLNVARETVRAAAKAEAAAEIETLKQAHASEKATLESEMRAWRVRAGGEEVPDTTSGGTAVSSGAMTRAEFMALPKDQKDKIRREQPALVAEIYSRSA